MEGARLLASVEFDQSDPFAVEIRDKYQNGFLRAFSVGFRPLRSSPRRDGRGMVFEQQELLELSAVAVPAHPGALKKGYNTGGNSKEVIRVLGSLKDMLDALERPGFRSIMKSPAINREQTYTPSPLRHNCPKENKVVYLLYQARTDTLHCPSCSRSFRGSDPRGLLNGTG